MKVMNLLNRTWATGAMPMGAPGWPELEWKVASTCSRASVSQPSRCQLAWDVIVHAADGTVVVVSVGVGVGMKERGRGDENSFGREKEEGRRG